MTRPRRDIPVKQNVRAIREFGQGEGHMGPMPPKVRTRAEFAERSFRRQLMGIVGA